VSVKVMTWVWDHSQSRGSDRLVLLAIADCASEDGSNAYPSMAELVRKTGLSERAVQYAVKALVLLGELFVAANGGPRGCNRYRVVMAEGVQEMLPALDAPPQTVRGARNAGVQDMHPLNGATDAPRVHEVRSKGASGAPGTVLEPSENKTSSKSSNERKRGTRIPEDFKVTPEMHNWAKEHVPELGGLRETEKFINYWRAKTGAGATKLDWPATWRNWMLTAAERLAPRSGHKPYTNPTDPDAYSKGL
jgi:hypothetical protein